MKVAINEVEYTVWNVEDFLAVQKVLTGSFTEMLTDQAMDNCREKVLEEYWEEARKGNNDVQREIYEGVADIPTLYDMVIEDALHDTDYSSIDEMTEYIDRMEDAMSDIQSITGDYC